MAVKLEKMLPYRFKSYTGVVWPKTHVDQYNALTKRVNSYLKAGKKPPERLLNSRHKLFVMFSSKK